MPSGPASLKELAAFGLDYAFMAGSAKHLRPTGEMTVHPKGGGATAHWTARDYLLMTTSLAGDQPSDAPTVAIALAQIPHIATVRKQIGTGKVLEEVKPSGFTFGEWFENEVTHISGLVGEPLRQAANAGLGGRIAMSLFPYRAEVTFYGGGEGGDETLGLIFQAPAPPPVEGQSALYRPDLMRKTPLWRERITTIPYEIVLVCASLLARVPASARTVPPSGVGVTTATPERETPEPHHKAPAPVRENRPHANTARPSDSLESTEVGTGMQRHSASRARRPFHSRKDVLRHAEIALL